MAVKAKAKRTIVGLVCKVEMPCGCAVYVAHGSSSFFHKHWNNSTHVIEYCKDWKQHKGAVTAFERDLAVRMAKFRQKDYNATRSL